MYKIFKILFIILTSYTSVYSQNPSDTIWKKSLNKRQLAATLDKTIPQLLDSANIPGLSLAVISEGKIIYSQAYGVKNSETKEKLNINTIFEAASLSKPIFAYACLKFVEDGLLDLDKPLYQYLSYEGIQKDQRYRKITARMVLSHTSGFPNWRNNDSLRINFEPGERFSYSGEGYVYLQKVLEKIVGKDLNEIMIEKVFTPLDMTNSSYIWKISFDKNFATPHGSFGNAMVKNKRSEANAAASLHTTAHDYAKFIAAILNYKGLKKQSIQTMLAPQIQVPEKLFDYSSPLSASLSWGLGVGLKNNPDDNSFWHWGDNYNFKCYVAASQKRKDGVVYFTNSSNGLSIISGILQKTIGGDQAAIDMLGYMEYKSPGNLFKKNILTIGVQKAIEPFLDEKGKSTLIKEQEMNEIGYHLIAIKKVALAKEVFDLNIKAYPNSSNVYDSYAEACLLNGELELAAKSYLISFELDPDNKKAKHLADQVINSHSNKGNTEFRLKGYTNAKLITLAGSFNNWDGFHTIFFRKGDDWVCQIDLASGKYSYKIVVDGDWILDPGNPDIIEENGYKNSLLKVE